MEPSSSITKRLRASSQDSTASLQHDDYTVAWISALPLEMTVAEAMLDTIHTPLSQHPQDSNCYNLGSINGHNVVMACLRKGQYGTNNAATVATHLIRSFSNIQHCLMVGIGGGAPSSVDVRLGDAVVSTKVLQYDLGKALSNHFQHTACPISPSSSLLTAVSKLEASQNGCTNHFLTIIRDSAVRFPNYAHPKQQDRLFCSDYKHPEPSKSCDDCDRTKLVPRDARQSLDPVIHFGQIASGNQVIKDAHTRDNLSKSSPCLAIRGICDYSDSHKNKRWQEYAALTAAAYAKDLLLAMPPQLPTPSKRRKTQEPEILDTEVRKCLKALFVTDPAQDREDILDAKGQICQGTCKWVLSTEEFRTWEQNPPHLLWVSAPPGVGKTFLSIYLSKHFEALSVERYDTAAICFFCDNRINTRNTAVNILRGLIHQIIALEQDLVKVIMPVWDQRLSQLFESKSFGVLWKASEEMIEKSRFRSIYCVIDVLDECEHGSLSLLLTKFEQMSHSDDISRQKVKLVCLSRRFPERIPESLDLFAKIELDMMPAGRADVERFIAERVSTLARKKRFSEKMEARVTGIFQERSEGTFLWVSFMAQDLENKNLLQIETSLSTLPAGLNAIYDKILSQIDLSERDTINKMLEWILVATRPLRVPELCEAAGVRPIELLTRDEVCFELIKSCGHLLQIVKGQSLLYYDEEYCPGNMFWSLWVTFLHQSAKDYFIKKINGARHKEDSTSLVRLRGSVAGHLTQCFSNLSGRPEMRISRLYDLTVDFPLTLYATTSWHLHLQEVHDVREIINQNEMLFGEVSSSREAYGALMRSMGESEFQDYHEFEYSVIQLEESVMPLLHLACFRDLQNQLDGAWRISEKQISMFPGDTRASHLSNSPFSKKMKPSSTFLLMLMLIYW